MKLILEFDSMAEMLAFCREQVGQQGGDSPVVVPTPAPASKKVVDEVDTGLVGLGKRQVLILSALSGQGGQRTSWISEQAGIPVPALSTALKSLEKRGLVRKLEWGVWEAVGSTEGVETPSTPPEPKKEAPVSSQKRKKASSKSPDMEVVPPKPKAKAKETPKPKAKTPPPTSDEFVFSTVDQILGDI